MLRDAWNVLLNLYTSSQAALATKLDRSETAAVSALVGRVAAVSHFMDDSKARLSHLEQAAAQVEEKQR
jgi:hypothetical protein